MQTELPDGWQHRSFSDVAAVARGLTYSNDQECSAQTPGSCCVLRIPNVQHGTFVTEDLKYIKDVTDAHRSKYLVPSGSILMVGSNGNADRVGNCCYVETDRDYLFASFLMRVVPSEANADPKFFYYVLAADEIQSAITDSVEGTTGLKNISLEMLRGQQVLLPPLPEQKKIAEILGSVDEAIRATEAVIEQTRRVKEGLLQELLTKGIGHTKFKQTEIGEIPEGWEVAPLRQVTTSLDSRRVPVKAEDRAKRHGPFRYYGASGVIDWIDDFIFDEQTLLVAEDGFNLVRRSTPIAFVVEGQYWVNNHAHVLGIKGDTNLHFLAAVLERLNLEPFLTGFEMPKLNAKALGNIKVPVPKGPEQDAIAERIHCVELALEQHRSSQEQLLRLKSGLLQDLLTGKVRVRP